MLFHKEKKQCMFLPPKNGTTTAQIFLKKSGWHYLKPQHVYPEMLLEKHPNLAGYNYYAFFRNPLERFVSSIIFTKQKEGGFKILTKVIEDRQLGCTVEDMTYDQFVDNFSLIEERTPSVVYEAQSRWMTLPGTEILDFDNYEAEIRRISGDYVSPVIVQNKSTDFGKSVVTQKVIDFVRQHYAADYALAKDRLGKEY